MVVYVERGMRYGCCAQGPAHCVSVGLVPVGFRGQGLLLNMMKRPLLGQMMRRGSSGPAGWGVA